MTLNTRANHAARALQVSVSEVSPVGMTAVTRRHRRSVIAGLVGALAIAFASIALASTIPDLVQDDTATIDRTTPDIPDTAELALLPEDGAKDEVFGVRQKYDVSDGPEPFTQFVGTAEPGTVVIARSEYGSADLVVGESGEFSLKLSFEGAPTGEPFPVIVTVGDEEHEFGFTWLWDPAGVDITAHQTYRISDDAEAFEKFFGTAPPGTVVIATSEFGTADTVASEHGEWFLKLEFSELPFDEPFEIEVTVGDEVFIFTFESVFDGDSTEISVTQFGKISDDPNPYTRFAGTAPHGTHVLATSAYGSADLEVGEGGEFSLKVWFSNPPAGVTFPITLKIDGETWETYYFTSWFDPSEVEVTVNQYNTASESSEPWVKFTGTAPIGTQMQITSAYGSKTWTTEGIEWLGKLYFSSLPPAGVEFPVTVKVNGETWGTYSFTSWYEEPEAIPVTVNHAYSTCSLDPPFDDLWGTAPAGTGIQIVSPYGSRSLEVGESGSWEKRVYFEGAPDGEPFTVTVKVNGSTHTSYSFTVYAPE